MGYEGSYDVSSFGNVRSYMTTATGEPRELKKNISRYGYACVALYSGGKAKLKRVSRLVAESFIPNPFGKPFVDHIDGVRLNNHVDNLRWVTSFENMRNPVTLAAVSRSARARVSRGILPPFKGRGDESPVAKAVCQFKTTGDFVARYGSGLLASENTGFERTGISRCCRGEQASFAGYIWRFETDCTSEEGTPVLTTKTP